MIVLKVETNIIISITVCLSQSQVKYYLFNKSIGQAVIIVIM